jgi:DNA-binding PadR family transcriptional regulator
MFGRFDGFNPFEKDSTPPDRGSRMFKKGDMKYVILDLLKDKPAHGYDITLALEERFHGLYSPSAGSVYPVLQLLEDMEYVTSVVGEGKKIYTITDAGKHFLEDNKKTTEQIDGRLRGLWGLGNKEYWQTVREAMNHLHELRYMIMQLGKGQDPAKIARLNEVLVRTIKDIGQIQ